MIDLSIIRPLRRIFRNCSRVQLASSSRRRIRRSNAKKSNGEQLEVRALLAAVAWDGGAGTLSRADAANWDTDTVPGAADDVTIDIVGDNTINVAGTFSVCSFSSQESLFINGGPLTTNGSSTVAGTFGMRANTTFTVDGVGSVFTAPATTTVGLGNLIATNGGRIDFSSVTTAENAADIGVAWRATGAGSRIDFSNLAEIRGIGRNGQQVIEATDGGEIDLTNATAVPHSTVQMAATGAGSRIITPALQNWTDANRNRSSTLTWGDGGTVDVGALESLTGVGVTATDGNVLTFPALTHFGGIGDSSSNTVADGVGSRI